MEKIDYIIEGINNGLIVEKLTHDEYYKYWECVDNFVFRDEEYIKGEKIGMPLPTEKLHIDREKKYRIFLIDLIILDSSLFHKLSLEL